MKHYSLTSYLVTSIFYVFSCQLLERQSDSDGCCLSSYLLVSSRVYQRSVSLEADSGVSCLSLKSNESKAEPLPFKEGLCCAEHRQAISNIHVLAQDILISFTVS